MENPKIDRILSFCLFTGNAIISQILLFCSAYMLVLLDSSVTFSSYKEMKLKYAYKTDEALKFANLILMNLSLLENLLLDITVIFLWQDEKLSIWCHKDWKFKILDLFVKITVIFSYVMDAKDSYLLITSVIIAIFEFAKIVLRFWSFLGLKLLRQMANLIFDCGLFFLEALIIICNLSLEETTQNYYEYTILILPYSFIIAIIRLNLNNQIEYTSLKSEEEALDFIRKLLKLCHSTENSSYIVLWGLLTQHHKSCGKPNCICNKLFAEGLKIDKENISNSINLTAYETIYTIPEWLTQSWKYKVLGFLVSEINPQISKSYQLGLTLSEIAFYYSANHYQAVCLIETNEFHKQSILCNQYTTNLKSMIETGMWNKQKEAVNLIAALNFQKSYDEFLLCIDDTTEQTVKFWSHLLEDKPDASILMNYGKNLHEKRCEFINISQKITELNQCNLEFLIKFGLYMKFIMHDKYSASQAYQKIMWTSENIASGLVENESQFFMFQEGCQVMLIVVSLDHSNFFTITAANNEIEYQLGYKKEELIRFSGNKLMPGHIASQHHQFVTKFFQTMESKNIGIERPKFIKHQDGCIVSCRATKHIIPSIINGCQGVMQFYMDPYLTFYASQKTDPTKRRVFF